MPGCYSTRAASLRDAVKALLRGLCPLLTFCRLLSGPHNILPCTFQTWAHPAVSHRSWAATCELKHKDHEKDDGTVWSGAAAGQQPGPLAFSCEFFLELKCSAICGLPRETIEYRGPRYLKKPENRF